MSSRQKFQKTNIPIASETDIVGKNVLGGPDLASSQRTIGGYYARNMIKARHNACQGLVLLFIE